jgi:branched-chain amino acid transport system substrate-binding protein
MSTTLKGAAAVVTVGAVLALAACGSSSDPSSPGSRSSRTPSVISTAGCPASATATLTGKTLTIGASGPLSGPAAAVGTLITGAMKAYFDYINSLGGVQTVNGRKLLKLKVLDDQFVPSTTLTNIQQEVQRDDIRVFADVIGSANNDAVAPYLKSQCDPQIAPQGSPTVNTADQWEDYAYAPYATQGAAWAKYMEKRLPADKTVAVLYQNDDVGLGTYHGFQQAIAGTGVKIVSAQSYEPNAVDVSSQMTTLEATKASVFIDASFATACTQSFAALANSSWRPVAMVDGSCGDLNISLAPKTAEHDLYGVEMLKSVKSPDYKNDPDVQLFGKWMAKEHLAANDPTENGWYGGELVVKTLESARQFTPAGIAAAAATLPDFTPGLMYPDVTVHGWHLGLPIIDTFAVAKFDPASGSFLAPVATIVTKLGG